MNREAVINGQKILEVVSCFPTVEQAWTNHMMPIILEGSCTTPDQLVNEFLDRIKRAMGFGPKTTPPPLNRTMNAHGAEMSGYNIPKTRDPDRTMVRPRADRVIPHFQAMDDAEQASRTNRFGAVQRVADSKNQASAAGGVAAYQSWAKSHQEALAQVQSMAKDLLTELQKLLAQKQPPYNLKPGIDVLDGFIKQIQPLLNYNPAFDEKGAMDNAQGQHKFTQAEMEPRARGAQDDGSTYARNANVRAHYAQPEKDQYADDMAAGAEDMRRIRPGMPGAQPTPALPRGTGRLPRPGARPQPAQQRVAV